MIKLLEKMIATNLYNTKKIPNNIMLINFLIVELYYEDFPIGKVFYVKQEKSQNFGSRFFFSLIKLMANKVWIINMFSLYYVISFSISTFTQSINGKKK